MAHKLDIVAYEAKKAKEKALKDKNVGVNPDDWSDKDKLEYLWLNR